MTLCVFANIYLYIVGFIVTVATIEEMIPNTLGSIKLIMAITWPLFVPISILTALLTKK